MKFKTRSCWFPVECFLWATPPLHQSTCKNSLCPTSLHAQSHFLCLTLLSAPSLPPSCPSARLLILQCTYCQLAMEFPVFPFSFFTSSLPFDLWLHLLTSLFHNMLSTYKLGFCCLPNSTCFYTRLYPQPPSPDIHHLDHSFKYLYNFEASFFLNFSVF